LFSRMGLCRVARICATFEWPWSNCGECFGQQPVRATHVGGLSLTQLGHDHDRCGQRGGSGDQQRVQSFLPLCQPTVTPALT
jgi:hypothetical protein